MEPVEEREALQKVGGLLPKVADRHQANWQEEDWYEMQMAKTLGISPEALKYTWVKDYIQGWRDTDWMSGVKRNERWRVQLSRKLTSAEVKVITNWFESLPKA